MTLNAWHIPFSIAYETCRGDVLRVEARSSLRTASEKRNDLGLPKDSVLTSPLNAFEVLLSHARQLKFDEEPDYDGLQQVFIDEISDEAPRVFYEYPIRLV